MKLVEEKVSLFTGYTQWYFSDGSYADLQDTELDDLETLPKEQKDAIIEAWNASVYDDCEIETINIDVGLISNKYLW